MKTLIGLAMVTLLMLASCGGGSSMLIDTPDNTQLETGVIDGYITEADIDRGTSDVDDGIEDVEVWCEDPGTGQRLGQDTTDEHGYYRLEGVPTGEAVMLKFQYQNRSQAQSGDPDPEMIEGEQQVMLQTREQLRIDAGVCEFDEDGDGIPDGVECDNDQLQVRLRTRGGNNEDE